MQQLDGCWKSSTELLLTNEGYKVTNYKVIMDLILGFVGYLIQLSDDYAV